MKISVIISGVKKYARFYVYLIILVGTTVFPQISNVKVTTRSNDQNEPMLAINPTDPNKLICGYNDQFTGTYNLGWSWSDNGGYNWTHGGNFTFPGYNRGGDPVVAFDSAGTAYIAGLAYNYDNTTGSLGKDGSIFLAKSNDGGKTFNVFQKIIAAGSVRTPSLDKPWLYINPINNHIYLAWVRRNNAWGIGGAESSTIWFTRSTDGGVNFSSPIQISTFNPATGTNRSHGPQISATSANKILVSWHTLEDGNLPNPPTTPWKIWIAESTDGGASFGTNHSVLSSEWGYPIRFISLDADRSNGKIYIAYADSHVQSPRDYDIFITSSTSASGPWSTPTKINDNSAGTWQYWPSLDIAPNGRVDVMWYDQRDGANRIGVYYSYSIDGGASWSTNKKITNLPIGFPSSSDFAGDYNAIASLKEKSHIAWMDNRNSNQEIYTSTVIHPIDSICFPQHRGVPGNINPPVIDGKVAEDVGWRGAYRMTYGNGTNTPHMAYQAIKHKTDDFIYLSFEVRNDDSFDNNDAIVLNFRPDITNNSTLNDRKIVIFPICDNIGAGGQNCSTTTPDDKINQPPRQIKFYRNSTNWIEIPSAQISNYEAKVRSYSDGSVKAWNVELKLPTSISNGGFQWVNFSDAFLFYSNVIRVSGSSGTANEFRWPREAPEINGDLNLYTFYPWDWGKANKSNSAQCNGVYLSRHSDIGTTNTPASQIKFTSVPNTFKNTFFANVKNNSEIGGVAQQVDDIFVRFRIANWGIPGPNDWADIQVVNPACPNISSNPTCAKNIGPATGGNPGIETFNLEWQIPDAEIPNYQTNSHQCILAEVDSRSEANIVTKSIYRNMDFVQASLFKRTAQISANGYGLPPAGYSNQKFKLRIATQEYAYGGGKSFDTLALKRILNKTQFDEKETVSLLNYAAHGYRYNGRSIIIDEKLYDITDPVGSFGYVVNHKGKVKEWKHQLVGMETTESGYYTLNIPAEDMAVVITEIEPIEDFNKWSFSLHSGIAIPVGNFSNSFDPGFNFMVDTDYKLSPNWSIIGLFGYNKFRSSITNVSDTHWLNISLNLRRYNPLGQSWFIYYGAGPGLYIPENGKSEFGGNIGMGFNYMIGNSLSLEMGIDYNTIFSPNVQFLHSHIGLVFRP